MKPVKLTMSAFGSYVKPQTIDFTNFYDKGIFLITGPTGAGKTTIFDGICYALYGHTSNSDKDENYIRNDLADNNILTYVELEFELKGKRYCIRRTPKQLRKKLKGDGYTEKPAEAELNLIDEDKVVTGITEVNEKIIELVGLEYEQFRQIIMIPQGEFRQLLTAKSKDREEILRKIFGTNEYRKIQEALDNMTKSLKTDIVKLEEGLRTNIKSINAGDNDKLKDIINKEDRPNIVELNTELKAQIDMDKGKIKELEKSISILEKEIADINKEITKGMQINALLEKKRAIEQEKRQLESRRNEIKILRESLEKGRKALCIKAIEENYNNSRIKVKDKERELEGLHKNLEKAKRELEQAENELEKQLQRNEEANKLKEEIGLFSSFVDKVKNYDVKRKEKEKLDYQFRDLKGKLDGRVKAIEIIKDKIKGLSDKKESLKNCEKDYANLEIRLKENEDVHRKLISIIPLIKELEELKARCAEENSKYLSLQNRYESLKEEAENTRRKFIEGYAGKLARELEDGIPCPVCGSTHHPNLAKLIDDVPNEDDLKNIEEKLDKLDAECRKVKDNRDNLVSQCGTKECIINERKNEISEAIKEDISRLEGMKLAKFVNDKAKEIQKQIYNIKSKLEELKIGIEEEKRISQELKDLEVQRETYENEREQLNNLYTQVYAKLESEKNLLQELEKELPEDIRSEAGLREKISQLEAKVKEIETAIKKAQEKQQNCRDTYNSLIHIKEERVRALEEFKKECMDLEKKFKEQICRQGFADEEEYRNAKLTEEEIEGIDNNIKKYNEDLKSVNDRYNQIVAETKDLEAVDISALENKLAEKEQDRKSVIDSRTEVYSRLENNERIFNNIKDLNEKISEKEKEYALVGELSSVANGRNNYRVTFETYVLAAYFEEVIDAANVRLKKMTKNRFQMERIKEEGTGNGYKGLDINIFDGNSGQCRPIKNISGGESFKASLALALGLSDVVQSYAGGIKLDTMFIDEGFGSLDSASLDDAINCLLELQSSGRLVGIISHVKELQERIHSRIEVESNVDGSKVKCICL